MASQESSVASPTALAEWLRSRLAQGLPGRTVQSWYEPELSFGRHYAPPPPDARVASVAVLVCRGESDWIVPLTVRPETMADHAGQVSFPGGRVEPGEDSLAAALRELEEELGVRADGIQVVGKLSPLFVFASHFHITPWLLTCERRLVLAPCDREVALVLEPTITSLLDRANWSSHRRSVRGLEFQAPHFDCRGHKVWGATGMVLAELVAIWGKGPTLAS